MVYGEVSPAMYSTMTPTHESRAELLDACRAGNVSHINELFAKGSLGPEQATNALKNVRSKCAVLRALLAHGADAGAVDVRRIPKFDRPKEALQILADRGYDFKIEGHGILE